MDKKKETQNVVLYKIHFYDYIISAQINRKMFLDTQNWNVKM